MRLPAAGAPFPLTRACARLPAPQVHQQFELLGFEHVYVTFAGQLLGIIRRSHLTTEDSG